VTALVPLALADVFAALTANLRMIRRVAEIYGGRSGLLGSWRLTRAVFAHLVATGAVATVAVDVVATAVDVAATGVVATAVNQKNNRAGGWLNHSPAYSLAQIHFSTVAISLSTD
jgi:uncharacterized protein (DUF697 family)